MSTKKPAGNVDIIDEFDFDNYDYVQNYDKNGQIDIPECRPISMAKVEYAHNKDRETRIFKPMEGAHVYPQLERISSTLQCQWDYRKDLKEKAGVIRPSDASVKIQGSAKITNNNYYYSEDDFSFIDFYDDAINCFGQLVLEKTFQLPHERQPAILEKVKEGLQKYGRNFSTIKRKLLPNERQGDIMEVYYSWKSSEDAMSHRNTRGHLYRKIKRNKYDCNVSMRSLDFNQVTTRRSYRARIEEELQETENATRPLQVPILQPKTNKETPPVSKQKPRTLDSTDQSEIVLSRAKRSRKPSKNIFESFESLDDTPKAKRVFETVVAIESLNESKNVARTEKVTKALKEARTMNKSKCEKVIGADAQIFDMITLSDSEEELDLRITEQAFNPMDQNVGCGLVNPSEPELFNNTPVNEFHDFSKENNLFLSFFYGQPAKAKDLGFNIVDDYWMPETNNNDIYDLSTCDDDWKLLDSFNVSNEISFKTVNDVVVDFGIFNSEPINEDVMMMDFV